jgi:hypothetical protein
MGETFEHEQVIQTDHGQYGSECAICAESTSITYRLESETHAADCCGDCFAGWLVEHGGSVTLDLDY